MKIRCLPWYTQDCITFLNNLFKWFPGVLQKTPTVLEIGGGNSTLYYLSKGCSVVCIESDDAYIDSIIGIARSAGYIAHKSDWTGFTYEAVRT